MFEYNATLVRVIDGDTVVLKLEKEYSFPVDFGFYILEDLKVTKSVELHFRMLGINTPEMIGAEAAQGKLAKEEMIRLLSLGTLKATTYKPDKYGRWLVTIVVSKPDQTSFNVGDELIKNGFAVPYMVKK